MTRNSRRTRPSASRSLRPALAGIRRDANCASLGYAAGRRAPRAAAFEPLAGPRPRRRSRAAFTLLELFVALAMASILVAALFASMSVAFRARDRAESAVLPSRTVGAALDFLGDDLESAQPPRETLIGAFLGTEGTDAGSGRPADTINFFTTAGPQSESAAGEVKRVELGIELLAGVVPGTQEYALVRRVTSNPLSPEAEVPEVEVLCRGVTSMEVEYYEATVGWVQAWDSSQYDEALPAAVRVTLELSDPPLGYSASGEAVPHRYSRVFRIACTGVSPDAGAEAAAGETPAAGGTTP